MLEFGLKDVVVSETFSPCSKGGSVYLLGFYRMMRMDILFKKQCIHDLESFLGRREGISKDLIDRMTLFRAAVVPCKMKCHQYHIQHSCVVSSGLSQIRRLAQLSTTKTGCCQRVPQ